MSRRARGFRGTVPLQANDPIRQAIEKANAVAPTCPDCGKPKERIRLASSLERTGPAQYHGTLAHPDPETCQCP